MLDYSYIPVNGHIVSRIRGRQFLVDPALPHSIADRPLLLEDRVIDVNREVMGLQVGDYNRIVGVELDGVLGGNVGRDFVVNILPDERKVVFDHYLSDFAIDIEIENLGSLAVMHNSIGGKRVRGAMNLGSRLSFIRGEFVESYESIGREKEVFGFIGEREVEVYSLPVMIGRQSIQLRFGVFPDEIADWLEMANVQAALGSELLNHFSVSLATEAGSISLDPLH